MPIGHFRAIHLTIPSSCRCSSECSRKVPGALYGAHVGTRQRLVSCMQCSWSFWWCPHPPSAACQLYAGFLELFMERKKERRRARRDAQRNLAAAGDAGPGPGGFPEPARSVAATSA